MQKMILTETQVLQFNFLPNVVYPAGVMETQLCCFFKLLGTTVHQ